MRIPDPKANTTTEAYLAYKAGYLEESELKPVLYEPYLHFDAWLAYWAGLTSDYPHRIGKNLLNASADTGSLNGVNYIKNGDGTYTVNGTANGTSSFVVGSIELTANTQYIVSGCPSGGSGSSYNVRIRDANYTALGFDVGSGVTITPTETKTYYYQITVVSGYSASNLVFKPMICLSTAPNPDYAHYEPYTGGPEMLTDEEALVAYLSGVTDTYPEEIKDPYDVRIVGYLKYLVSARWGRPEYPVNNEEFYLSTMKPPVVPSGDTPSSDIEMDDTVEAPFVDLKMYGDTSQNTCAGDQLLTKQGFATPITDTSFWGSFAQSKLKHTPLADGWAGIEVKETSGSVFGDMNINQEGVKGFAANTTYTIIVEIKDKSGAGTDGDNMKNLCIMQPNSIRDAWESSSVNIVQGAIWTGGTNVVVTLADSDWTSRTAVIVATTKEDLTNVFSCRFFTRPTVPAGTSFKIRVSVLAGDHSSDWQNYAGDNYQPYVGGIPAPNPEYPQEIQTVTGEQTVMVTGRNLLDEQTMQQGSFNFLTGVEATDARRIRSTFIECKPNTNYNLSANVGLGEFAVIYKAQDGTIIAGEGASTNEQSYSFTSNANAYYMRIRVGNGPYPKTTEGNYGLMLAEGSVPTTYEPYQSQSYTIDLGSTELCKIDDYQDYIYKSGNDWYLHKEVGSFDLSTGTYVATTGSIRGLTNAPNVKYAPNNQTIGSAVTSGYKLRQGQGLGVAGVGWFAVDTNRVNFNTGGSTDPVGILYYALATPTDTQITNSALIAQLDALMEGGSYEGKTYIKVTATDPNLTGLLYVEAGKNV